MQHWADDRAACLVFDVIIKLHEPVVAPGGLNTWTMKPSEVWAHPHKLTKKETMMSDVDLGIWRKTQEAKYHRKALEKRVALTHILQAIQLEKYMVTYSM